MASSKKSSGSVAFGEISPGAVKSLADLLYLSHIDKKLLQTLGEFFYRMSDSLLMSKLTNAEREQETSEEAEKRRKSDLERSRANFDLII